MSDGETNLYLVNLKEPEILSVISGDKETFMGFAQNIENTYRSRYSRSPAGYLFYCIDGHTQTDRHTRERERERVGKVNRHLGSLNSRFFPEHFEGVNLHHNKAYYIYLFSSLCPGRNRVEKELLNAL